MTVALQDRASARAAASRASDTFVIGPERVLRVHVAAIAVLVGASVLSDTVYLATGFDTMLGYRPLFHLDMEWNIPTFFSGLALLASALLLFMLARRYKSAAMRDWPYLAMLGIVFLFLAYDEVFSMHERLISVLQSAVTEEGIFHYAWIIVGIPFAAAVFVLSIGFLRRTDRDLRNLMILSGAVFCTGALGFEALSGWRDHALGDAFGRGKPDAIYLVLMTIEETLEMVGIALFIYTLLRLFNRHFGAVAVRIE